ncbi:hypothetical protein QQF64_030651 [Cirrhinus molitorella]|uniref:Uncharacterized protein n=2 Tax=Cirrhinus molitorella TaxID=172907 RepID=A0ABR3N3W8_9TELE|nr:hypothetical protein Q8A67_001977 [Cirrhinus molitorella]
MSKPICLLFVLVILTTILCYNPVCSQRGSLKQIAACGCNFHPNGSLRCTKRHNLKTGYEYNEVVKCICRNPTKYLNEDLKKTFVRMCNKLSMPL